MRLAQQELNAAIALGVREPSAWYYLNEAGDPDLLHSNLLGITVPRE